MTPTCQPLDRFCSSLKFTTHSPNTRIRVPGLKSIGQVLQEISQTGQTNTTSAWGLLWLKNIIQFLMWIQQFYCILICTYPKSEFLFKKWICSRRIWSLEQWTAFPADAWFHLSFQDYAGFGYVTFCLLNFLEVSIEVSSFAENSLFSEIYKWLSLTWPRGDDEDSI